MKEKSGMCSIRHGLLTAMVGIALFMAIPGLAHDGGMATVQVSNTGESSLFITGSELIPGKSFLLPVPAGRAGQIVVVFADGGREERPAYPALQAGEIFQISLKPPAYTGRRFVPPPELGQAAEPQGVPPPPPPYQPATSAPRAPVSDAPAAPIPYSPVTSVPRAPVSDAPAAPIPPPSAKSEQEPVLPGGVFRRLAAHLDLDGDILEVVDGKFFIRKFRSVCETIQELFRLVPEIDLRGKPSLWQIVERTVKPLDLLSCTGFGSSRRTDEQGVCHSRFVLLKRMAAAAPAAAVPDDYLPSQSLLAIATDLDFGALHRAVEEAARLFASDDELDDVEDFFANAHGDMIRYLRPGSFFTLIKTFDGLGAVCGVSVDDDALYRLLREKIGTGTYPRIQAPDFSGFPEVDLFPLGLHGEEPLSLEDAVLAYDAKRRMLLFASSQSVLATCLKAARNPSLRLPASPDFQRVSKGLVSQGPVVYLAPSALGEISASFRNANPVLRHLARQLSFTDIWYVERSWRVDEGVVIEARYPDATFKNLVSALLPVLDEKLF